VWLRKEIWRGLLRGGVDGGMRGKDYGLDVHVAEDDMLAFAQIWEDGDVKHTGNIFR
jgi:hypothetical protein